MWEWVSLGAHAVKTGRDGIKIIWEERTMMRLFSHTERMAENKIAKEIEGGRVCGSKERGRQKLMVGWNGGAEFQGPKSGGAHCGRSCKIDFEFLFFSPSYCFPFRLPEIDLHVVLLLSHSGNQSLS